MVPIIKIHFQRMGVLSSLECSFGIITNKKVIYKLPIVLESLGLGAME
jgi:hypothetical protein